MANSTLNTTASVNDSAVPMGGCYQLCFWVTLTDNHTWSEPRRRYWNACDNSTTRHPDCLLPLSIETSEMNPYSELVYGKLLPAVVALTCVTNLLICLVLFKKHMRTPANCLLIAMAVADLLTGLCSLPCFLHFYTLGHFRDWVPAVWCSIYVTLVDYLPTIFHTASIWLTAALATQRYVHVCHSHTAKRYCQSNSSLVIIVVVYAVAALSQLCRFFEYNVFKVNVPSRLDPSVEVESCVQRHSPFVWRHLDAYFTTYYSFRVVFIHIIPCLLLVVVNALLINAMRHAQTRRRRLLKQNRKYDCRRLSDSQGTTLMLVTVVFLFLLVEIPLAIVLVLNMVKEIWQVPVFDDATVQNATMMFINLAILLSYPLNFFIYCTMSRRFRDTFKCLFVRGSEPPAAEGSPVDKEPPSNFLSCATENVITNLTSRSPRLSMLGSHDVTARPTPRASRDFTAGVASTNASSVGGSRDSSAAVSRSTSIAGNFLTAPGLSRDCDGGVTVKSRATIDTLATVDGVMVKTPRPSTFLTVS